MWDALSRFIPFKTPSGKAAHNLLTAKEHRFPERFLRGIKELRILNPDTLMSRQNDKASQEFGSDVIFQFFID